MLRRAEAVELAAAAAGRRAAAAEAEVDKLKVRPLPGHQPAFSMVGWRPPSESTRACSCHWFPRRPWPHLRSHTLATGPACPPPPGVAGGRREARQGAVLAGQDDGGPGGQPRLVCGPALVELGVQGEGRVCVGV